MEKTLTEELFVYHQPRPDQVEEMKGIAGLAGELVKRIEAVETLGVHSISNDFKLAAILSLKNAVMQINTAIIMKGVSDDKTLVRREEEVKRREEVEGIVAIVRNVIREDQYRKEATASDTQEVANGAGAQANTRTFSGRIATRKKKKR